MNEKIINDLIEVIYEQKLQELRGDENVLQAFYLGVKSGVTEAFNFADEFIKKRNEYLIKIKKQNENE